MTLACDNDALASHNLMVWSEFGGMEVMWLTSVQHPYPHALRTIGIDMQGGGGDSRGISE